MTIRRTTVAVAAALALAGSAQAALLDRGGGLIYDDDRNITWLQDANFVAQLTDAQVTEIVNGANAANPSWLGTHTMVASDFFKSSGAYTGRMTWWGAMAWADELSHGGYNDWRLPMTLQPDPSCSQQIDDPSGTISQGYDCSGGEMGHLFFEDLGGTSTGSSTVLIDPYPFINMKEVYWSGTVYAHVSGGSWEFNFAGGSQAPYNNVSDMFAMAVRDGDVLAVPEPEAYALMLAGLGVLRFARWGRGSRLPRARAHHATSQRLRCC